MLQKRIVEWIKQYAKDNNRETLVIGISGGIDSSVVSTLCAMTKMKTIAVSLPLNQIEEQHDLSMDHGDWLSNKYKNVYGQSRKTGKTKSGRGCYHHSLLSINTRNMSLKTTCLMFSLVISLDACILLMVHLNF